MFVYYAVKSPLTDASVKQAMNSLTLRTKNSSKMATLRADLHVYFVAVACAVQFFTKMNTPVV